MEQTREVNNVKSTKYTVETPKQIVLHNRHDIFAHPSLANIDLETSYKQSAPKVRTPRHPGFCDPLTFHLFSTQQTILETSLTSRSFCDIVVLYHVYDLMCVGPSVGEIGKRCSEQNVYPLLHATLLLDSDSDTSKRGPCQRLSRS